jgi:hypothetical protein
MNMQGESVDISSMAAQDESIFAINRVDFQLLQFDLSYIIQQ